MKLSPQAILHRHLPPAAVGYCLDLWQRYPFQLVLRRSRLTRVGDFCAHRDKGPIITLNYDLSPYVFLVTYIHEFSHHAVWIVNGNSPEPHGKEWKLAFRTFMSPLMEMDIFPPDLHACLVRHLKNPKASSYSDARLTALFRKYDERKRDEVLVSHLPEGAVFSLNGKTFRKGPLRRTRYLCTLIPGGRSYLVPGDLATDRQVSYG